MAISAVNNIDEGINTSKSKKSSIITNLLLEIDKSYELGKKQKKEKEKQEKK